MTAAVIAASILLALFPPAAYVALAVRYPQRFPLPAWIAGRLEKTRWPELRIRLDSRHRALVEGPGFNPGRKHGVTQAPRDRPLIMAAGASGPILTPSRLRIPDLLTIPFRLRSAGGEHTARAVAERTLVFDPLRGQYRHAETGPMTLPQQYLDYAGKAAEGWWAS